MKKYPKTWRIVATILLCLFLLSVVSVMCSGCGTRSGINKPENKTWMLLRLPDGNTIHTEIVDYTILENQVMVYTESRVYITSPNNVCFIRDLE